MQSIYSRSEGESPEFTQYTRCIRQRTGEFLDRLFKFRASQSSPKVKC